MTHDLPLADVRSGSLTGLEADGIRAFLGVPYAAPPVGPHRWRPPQPPAAWSGVRAADRVGSIAMQTYNPLDPGVGPPPMSEDCLTLNVWTPASRQGPHPVMLWIHGGGLVTGSATARLYDGSALARQGVVVVTMNYRLGRLGFFAHPSLSQSQAGEPLANYGLMDQLAALRWVRDNIAAFGGDPGQVTLFGESAGGVCVQRLMFMDAARGLFQRAIVQSGAGLERNAHLRETNREGTPSGEAQGIEFADSLGLAELTPMSLRAVTAKRCVAGPAPAAQSGFGLIVDGDLLTHDVGDAFASGLQAPVPLLVGWNSLEYPVPDAQFDGVRRLALPSADSAQLSRIEQTYASAAEYRRHIVSDAIFNAGARHIASLHSSTGAPTYVYQFSVLSRAVQSILSGAPHASERPYVFRTLESSSWPTDETDEQRAREMSAYWIAFAKTGNPNDPGLPKWPRYARPDDVLLEFTNEGPVERQVARPRSLDAITDLRTGAA